MANTTVYLAIHDMTGVMSDTVIGMINHRCANTKGVDHVDFESGTTYAELRARYKTYKPIKGAGGDRFKDSVPYWVLPFWTAPGMPDPDPLVGVTLSAAELNAFGWDVEEIDV